MTTTFRLPPYVPPPFPPQAEPYDRHRDNATPLIIDNGATTLRWGFATADSPFSGPNAIAKYKERRTNKPLLLFGEGIDTESGAKGQTRTPWEGDVLLNFDALENALDYTFIHLGIDTPSVNHPVLMTERLATPLHSRALTSELMFELYSVPSLAFAVDGPMSFYQNYRPPAGAPFTSDGLVLSFNTASTSVIPMLNGKGILSHAKRIPWGASQTSEYLLKLLQLKYPNFPTKITAAQTNWMLQNHCEFSPDYGGLLKELNDPAKLQASERIIQFPFTVPVVEEKTEEELNKAAERRKEQGRKLQEMAAKSRAEKLNQKESDLQSLLELREAKATDSKREWTNKLRTEGFDDEAALDDTIKKLETYLKKARKKDGDADEPMEEPTFPLVDIPDADLDEDQLKEKKKQRLLKAGWEARMRARKEKEREREEKEREERREEEERQNDLTGWAQNLRSQQEALMNKIKDRNRRKAAMTDRKSAAAQARMKSIANLAADEGSTAKKKRRAGGDDNFGEDDADWQIYRKINVAAPSSDEEDDVAQLQVIENKLLTYDPTFTDEHTHAFLTTQRSALLSAFRPHYDEGDVEGHTRIHLNVERWRVPETYFSPGMAGVDTAGLGEVIQNILSRFTEPEKTRLVNNIFLTGSPSNLPGLIPRLHTTLRPILNPETPISIVQAADPSLDAWRGMAAFSLTPQFASIGVTRAEYEEHGAERVKRWWGGNWHSCF